MKLIKELTVLVTGATDGIGKLTALELARQQAHVLIHGRNKDKLTRVVRELQDASGNKKIEGFNADFSSLAEVRQLAAALLEKHGSLDVLINNAGVGVSGDQYTKDGAELRFTVNYLAPFLLTHLLLPALEQAAPSRIVNVSSAGQAAIDFEDIMLEKNFSGRQAYCQSKLALILFTIDLAGQLKDKRITVNSLHPGTYLDTNMVRKDGIQPLGTAQSGADAILNMAISPQFEKITGKYFDVRRESSPHRQAGDPEARKKLRELTRQLTGWHPSPTPNEP